MNLQDKIASLKKRQSNFVGEWDEYDRLGEIILEFEDVT